MYELNKILARIDKIKLPEKCLWTGCMESAIASHSQAKSILRNIAADNHVYEFNRNLVSLHKGNLFKKVGINKASIFPGFCSKHDNGLFSSIEKQNIWKVNTEKAFLLFIRGLYFEYYQKKLAIQKNEEFLRLCNEYCYPVDESLINHYNKAFTFWLENDFLKYNKIITSNYNKENICDMKFLSKIIPKNIGISLSTVMNPFLDMAKIGREPQITFAFHIIPYKNYSLIAISWFKTDDYAMQWIKKEFYNNLSKLINYLCFIESEDFTLSRLC